MRLNWFNFKYLNYDGYGKMGLGFVRALLQAGHDVRPFTIDALDQPGWFSRAQGMDFSNASVMLMPPHNMKHLPGRSFAFSMHESLALPDGWADHVNQKSQWLIVPSPWLIEPFTEAGVQVPIEVVPGGVDPDECPILTSQPGSSNRPYTFLALADRGNRKGYDKVWTAFYKAFEHTNRDVRLIIKCRPGSLPRLDFSYSNDPRLTVWRADVENMADVYAQADAYVCPARCEGYGMSQREAAACGLPTVVIRWSGTADNADEWAIPLNKFTLVESGMASCGGKWAEPDTDELVETMRWLFTHQDEAKAKGLQAAQWIRNNQTYAHAATALTDVMAKYLGGPLPVSKPETTTLTFTPHVISNRKKVGLRE